MSKKEPPLHFPFVHEEHRLSMTTENYLLSISRLEEQNIKVTAAHLSEHFKHMPLAEGIGISLPSVSAMIRRLIREKLILTTPDKQVIFTKLGRQLAESILRRHRLAERLVVDLLGVDLKLAHKEAHRLEHAISPYLEHRIVEALKHPTTCPFGHPIPGSAYKIHEPLLRLSEAIIGKIYSVNRIPEDDEYLLSYFVDKGFLPGIQVILKDFSSSRGVVTVLCEDRELVFSISVASLVLINE